MFLILSLCIHLFETYYAEFSFAVPKQEIVSEFISGLSQYPKDEYQWDYIMLNIITTESGDSLVGTEYFKACDLYVPKSNDCTLLYTIAENDTILIQGNLSPLFFKPLSSQEKINIMIDGSNIGVEELPGKCFQYKNGRFVFFLDSLDCLLDSLQLIRGSDYDRHLP